MRYEEFQDKMVALGHTKNEWVNRQRSTEPAEEIEIHWCTGGQSGGSCWGGQHYAVSGEPEPEFQELDEILEAVCPHITFLQYKRVCQEVIVFEENAQGHGGSDYYGNYRTYSSKTVNLRKLYDTLVEKELL
jgi:hypothetical protein